MPFFDPIRIGASGAADTTFTVDRSLRFNDDDNAYLERTPSSASNRTTFTLSVWLKRSGNLDNHQRILEVGTGTGHRTFFIFDGDDKLQINHVDSGSQAVNLTTTAKFRDISAWYHIVLAIDTTQGSSSDRIKIYVNGTQQTAFDTSTYPTSNKEFDINSTAVHYFGRSVNNTGKFDGYMAEINLIDGSQLTPASFGETNPVTGQWNPKKYTGSYGTNGFYLNFSDNSGTTATTLGKDSSGNGNNFTPNNFSVSAGAGNDSLEDTPTNNFCTLNALHKDSNTTLSDGNLKAAGSSSTAYNTNTQGTFAQSSGKWYYEVEFTSGSGLAAVGWARETLNTTDNPTVSGGIVYRPANGDYIDLAGNNPSTPPTTSTGTVIQVAIDFDAGKIWFGSGGTYFNSGNPSAGSSEAMTFTGGSEFLAPVVRSLACTFNFNFGQRAFSYTAPTGYKSLCSANLPDPTILLPNQHFNNLLYTGNGGTQSITGLNFQPDWVWVKRRNGTNSNVLFDAVRGATKELISNTTGAEGTEATSITSFDSNGYSVGSNGGVNDGSGNYVAWNWNAGDTDGKTYTVTVVDDSGNKFRFDGFAANAVTLDLAEGGTYIFNYPSGHPFRFSTTADGTHGGGSEYTTGVTHNSSTQVTIVVAASAPTLYYYCSSHSGMGGQVNTNSTLGSSNFDGAIQSVVKTNTTSGFSITTYTGTGSSTTVGHGLGVKPDCIIIKRKDSADNWMFYHKGVNTGVDPEDYYLELNSNGTQIDSTVMLNDTAPTSTSVTIGSDNSVNGSSATYIMYCFSEIASYSKVGSYQANGSSDGPFIQTNFRPSWILIKNISLGQPWVLMDNKINPHNLADTRLSPSSSDAELTSGDNYIDILSNGFKVRSGSSTDINYSTSYPNHIYLAFGEFPFKNARAR